jgi:outer membrane protein TolC
MADAKSMQAELEFLKQRNTVLLQARTLYTELIFSNIMAAVMKRRLDNAMNLALSYKTKFSLNECGIIEYNKAQLNLIATEKQNSLLELKRESLQAELNALNGGQPIPVTDTAYPAIIINPDFEQWYAQAEAKSPVLTWLKKEIEISRSQIKLNAASVLPKLTAGYMSEQVAGEQFQGITLGITIPLWENRNMVRYAKTYAVAAQSAEADQRLMFYNRLKTQHALVLAMMKQVEDYRTSMNLYSNAVLLKKSLDGGELSLIEYLNELILYYQNYEILLDAEKEMQLKNDELLQYVY